MSDLEPDWDSPLSLSLTPAAIFTVLFASADEVHTAWQSCVDSALVVGENMARDEGSANYCRLADMGAAALLLGSQNTGTPLVRLATMVLEL